MRAGCLLKAEAARSLAASRAADVDISEPATAKWYPPCVRRPSPNLASLNGGVPPSLEQLRPDMFFGLDDDDDDDASSGTVLPLACCWLC